MTIFSLTLAGFISWVVSTVGAGGGEFIMIVALIQFLLSSSVFAVLDSRLRGNERRMVCRSSSSCRATPLSRAAVTSGRELSA